MQTIKQAFNSGMEAFSKHCLRYGTIEGDVNFLDHTGKECRTYTINIQGVIAEITKRNGEVIEVAYNEANYA